MDSTALVNITDLKFRVHSGRTYHFAFFLIGRSTSQTQGQRFAVTVPTFTQMSYTVSLVAFGDGTAAFFEGAGTSSGDAVVSNQVPSAANDLLSYIHGNIVPSADGIVQAQFANENTVGTETTTVKAGSMGWLVEL